MFLFHIGPLQQTEIHKDGDKSCSKFVGEPVEEQKRHRTLEPMPCFSIWCPAAESNYELVLTMDPLCRLTSGARPS